MWQRAIDKEFSKLGWEIQICDNFSNYGFMRLTDRMVRIVLLIENEPASVFGTPPSGLKRFELFESLSTVRFSKYASIIGKKKKHFWSLLNCKSGVNICKMAFISSDIRNISEQVVQWAMEQDLDTALAEWCEMPTGMPRDWSVQHLCALAVCGDVDRLRHYQSSFEKGDCLGFVPDIKKEHIERALKLAVEQPKANWLKYGWYSLRL